MIEFQINFLHVNCFAIHVHIIFSFYKFKDNYLSPFTHIHDAFYIFK